MSQGWAWAATLPVGAARPSLLCIGLRAACVTPQTTGAFQLSQAASPSSNGRRREEFADLIRQLLALVELGGGVLELTQWG